MNSHTNKLINSISPYLLQHAHNPVDWYPWGNEAWERARVEDKPILLSIGYSACHWCHVMEKESFENVEIAKIMNDHFVCIKVDREEHPEIDEIYMSAVQMLTGSGGWPLNVFLTPDLKPFFGGTYFPPEERWGHPGFKQVLLMVYKVYREKRDLVHENASRITYAINSLISFSTKGTDTLDGLINDCIEGLKETFDQEWGGFGGAPKFPQSSTVELLLRYYKRTSDSDVLHMITSTLNKMAYGGMYDQIGGGFHRYSVDQKWLIPHFEKMLYDNARLAELYLDAFLVAKKPLYERIARGILDYVLREMNDSDGGFYSSQDADSEGKEGKYYVWSSFDVKSILCTSDAELFCQYYGLTEEGNFEGENVLHIEIPPEEFARIKGIELNSLLEKLKNIHDKLLFERVKRVPPARDDKILTDWNALMISAFAKGYQVLGDIKYLSTAKKAMNFIIGKMRVNDSLFHAHFLDKSHISGCLDDYAFVIRALLDLYEATFEIEWVKLAHTFCEKMIECFWDSEDGGFYFTQQGKSEIIARTKPSYDSATPSGNAVSAHVLLRLGKLIDRPGYIKMAEKIFGGFASFMKSSPAPFAYLLSAFDFYKGPLKEIAICGKTDDPDTQKIIETIRGHYIPNKVIALLDPTLDNASAIQKTVPLLDSKSIIDEKTTVYICSDYQCRKPVTSVEELENIIFARI